MQEQYCKFCGKIAHPTENAARRALSGLKQSKRYNGHVYLCIKCGFFHIGRIGKRTDRNNLIKKKERKKHVKRTRSIITIFLAGPAEGSEQVGLPDREPAQAAHLQGLYDPGEWKPDLFTQVHAL